jgi:transposase InsO family protein
VLTIIDRATRWPEVLPLQNMTARECADVFITGWVARYGVPQTVTTDRGTQFTSELWKSMCKTLGVHHVTTTAYHPQSNGMIERFHRQMKEGLRARECGTAWIEHLTVGPTGTAGCTEGGIWSFCSRSGVWQAACTAWPGSGSSRQCGTPAS